MRSGLKMRRSATDDPVMIDSTLDASVALDAIGAGHLVAGLPVGCAVLDELDRGRYGNPQLCEMTGLDETELIGASALRFLDHQDARHAKELMDNRESVDGHLLGPVRVRYLHSGGELRNSQVWARRIVAASGEHLLCLTFGHESVRDVLTATMWSITDERSLEHTLSVIGRSGRAAPLLGRSCLLLVEPTSRTDSDRFVAYGDWPLGQEILNAYGTPWRRSLVQGTPVDVIDCSLGDVDARTGAEMATAGVRGVLIRPVRSTLGDVIAVFVLWRSECALPTPNQNEHIAEIEHAIRLTIERMRNRRDVESAAHRDLLTGVGSRAALADLLVTERDPVGVIVLDLDQFKVVNEMFGHEVGDEVIAQVGRRLQDCVRRSDRVFRSGGDEFVVVCDAGTDVEGQTTLAARIVERLGAPYDSAMHRVRIGASLGLASGEPADGVHRPLRDTIEAARRAMHVAKERGRGTVHHADVHL